MKRILFLMAVGVMFFPITVSTIEPMKRNHSGNAFYGDNRLSDLPQRDVIFRGTSGQENQNAPPPFDIEDALRVGKEAQDLLASGIIEDDLLRRELSDSLAGHESLLEEISAGDEPLPERILSLVDSKYRLQNLLGLALKGHKKLRSIRNTPLGGGRGESFISGFLGGEKYNTGWIFDQKIYDLIVEKTYPTLPVDIRSNDEGASDIEVDDDGWVWHVQSFYFSDTANFPDHPNPSYSLAIYLSPDGGSTWWLYEILYDTGGKDLINPRLAIDILPGDNRFFIAYEYAYSETDHDIYVYSESFSSTPNAQDVGIGTSTLMERNPDIASDYQAGQTSYRVAVFEKEASAGSYNYDILASQSTGAGASADWSAAVSVAADTNSERNPSLSNGASGNSTFTQYMHLAYNYDVYSTNQLLLNSGFESGNDGNWTVNSTGDINCGGGYQRTGSCCAWLAGINSYTDFIYQDVVVPANAVSANLSFYLKITSAEGTTTAYDFLYIQLRDTSNNVLATLQTLSNKDKNTYAAYQPLSFDMLPYAGQTVRAYFLATTDSTNITSFFLDDTALNVTLPSGYEVRYARAQHPGGTSYPAGLQAAGKITVLSDYGIGWDYGAPSVISTHGGGSASWTQARVVVAADQHFPAGNPDPADLERHQVCFAWNMCNGGTTCGTMTCGEDTLSRNWQEGWFYDGRGDERYPSLIQDGAGLQTSGLSEHPFIYMAYFHRAADSPSELGEVQMILSDPSDETCDGFIYAYWYYFTASYTISDPDNLVSPVPRTINAFNYWGLSYAGAGATFNKEISHVSGGANDDIFCTTLGDNYSFYSYSGSDYLNLVISLDGVTYATKHTFAWASNYDREVIAVSPQEEGGFTYTFSNWSNSQTDPVLKIFTEYCDPVNPCATIDFIATFGGCTTMTPPSIDGISNLDGSCSLMIVFTQGAPAVQHDLYLDGEGTPVLTNISSPVYYSPSDGNMHNFMVRAVNGSCYADSPLYAQSDPDCGAVSCIAPVSEVIETVNTDKSGFKWTNISGADYYRVARGIQSNLPALITSGADFSCRSFGISDGATGFVFDGTDDSSGVSGRCYYYIIQGYDCEDPDAVYLGPPGSATAGARQVELTAACN
ncbi:MAG TPA: hypothetical protein PKJ37_05585 [Acidobacteriota bacterium]|nr:hypothetical protein [Acidobacteriota bacterium]HNT17352.1 hypothetical protein [Acidobacteriota bacterium]